jgi:hypothetical protein
VLDVLFLRAEGFSCSLGNFLSKKYIKNFSCNFFFQLLVIETLDLELDPDPHWDLDSDLQLEKMLDPYPDPH